MCFAHTGRVWEHRVGVILYLPNISIGLKVFLSVDEVHLQFLFEDYHHFS